jgi:DNA-binding NarL/FixJ family response regulator
MAESESRPQRGGDELEVWVIEDNPTFRRAVTALLQDEPSTCCTLDADSCEPAVEKIEDGHCPHVVLMDIGLPGMGGIEGTRRIKALSPTTEVVILTIHEDSAQVFDAIRAGASGYLLKPSASEEIIEAVHRVRRGQAAINPSIARRVLTLFSRLPDSTTEPPDYGLTPREREILQLMVDGLTLRQAAGRVNISFHTVDTHIRNIYAKLHVRSRASAVGKAISERIV